VVSNGQEAVDAASGTHYDVMFVDLQMPVLDGFGVARALRHKPDPTWLIALSADITAETQRQCRTAGFDDYVSKPVSVDDLASALGRAPRGGPRRAVA
jgi:CheY-like chemotaxis protein